MTLSAQDAQDLLGILQSILIPTIITRYASLTWPAWAKLALIFGVSIAGGFLTNLVAETPGQTLIGIIKNSILGSVSFYMIFVKALNLESIISPKQAVVTRAMKTVSKEVDALHTSTARKILDKNNDTTLHVETVVKQ